MCGGLMVGEVRVDLLTRVQLLQAGSVVDVRRAQVRKSLALLAARAGEVVPADVMIEHLWGEKLPADPRASMRVGLSRLRTQLGEDADRLTTEPAGYRLDIETDLGQYRDLSNRARQSEGDDAAALLEEALGLWPSEQPLQDLLDSPVLIPLCSELLRQRDQDQLRYIELLAQLQRHHDVLDVAGPLVDRDLGNEYVASLMARAMAATGHKSAALELLATTRNHLRDTLGLSAGPAVMAAEQDILSQVVDLAPALAGSPTPDQHVLVGRTAELEQLIGAGPGLHLITGEPGAGKSELLKHVAAGLRTSGRPVLHATASATPARPMEALTTLIVGVADTQPETSWPEGTAGVLARLAPDYVAPATTGPTSREALLVAAGHVLTAWSTGGNGVLVVDDMQWMDSASLAVLGMLDLDSCTIVGASRSAADQLPPAAGLIPSTQLALSPLTHDDVEEYLHIRLGRVQDGQAQQLFHRSGGSPLFLHLLTDLVLEGALDDTLPASILLAVQQRMAMLGAEERRTVEVASAFSGAFDLEVMEYLRPTAASDIKRAAEYGLVVLAGSRCWFSHALMAEAVYQLLAEGDRVQLHDEIGRALEFGGAPPATYSVHCSAAARIDPRRAVSAHAQAAREFAAVFAWDTAMLHADRGLETAEDFAVAAPELLGLLKTTKGTALRAEGDQAGDVFLLEALALIEDLDDPSLLTDVIVALCDQGRMASPEGERVYSALESLLQRTDDPVRRARLLAAGSTLVSSSSLQQSGREMYHEALDLALAQPEPGLRVEVLLRAHLGLPLPADLDRRRQAIKALAEIASEPDLQWELAFLEFGLANIENDVAAARRHLASLEGLTPRLRQRRRDFGMGFCRAAMARLEGDLEGAEAELGRTMEIGLDMFTSGWVEMTFAATICALREAQGRMGELLPWIEPHIAAEPDFPNWHCIAAAAAAAEGDEARLQAEIAWLRELGVANLSPDLSWPGVISILTQPVAAADATDLAEDLLDLVTPFDGLNLFNGVCVHRSAREAIEIFSGVVNR